MPGPGATADRRDWRDTLRAATDIALLGLLTTLAALPVVTAGAAAITASRSIHHWCEYDELPAPRTAARWFRRALLPGLGGLLVVSAVAAVLVADALLIGAGRVPGGGTALTLTLVVSCLLVGIAAIALVRIGQHPDRPWQAAAGAVPANGRAWLASLAAGGVVGFAATLGALLPLTVPLLPGATLLALHVLVRRLPPGTVATGLEAASPPPPWTIVMTGQPDVTEVSQSERLTLTRHPPLPARSSEDD